MERADDARAPDRSRGTSLIACECWFYMVLYGLYKHVLYADVAFGFMFKQCLIHLMVVSHLRNQGFVQHQSA